MENTATDDTVRGSPRLRKVSLEEEKEARRRNFEDYSSPPSTSTGEPLTAADRQYAASLPPKQFTASNASLRAVPKEDYETPPLRSVPTMGLSASPANSNFSLSPTFSHHSPSPPALISSPPRSTVPLSSPSRSNVPLPSPRASGLPSPASFGRRQNSDSSAPPISPLPSTLNSPPVVSSPISSLGASPRPSPRGATFEKDEEESNLPYDGIDDVVKVTGPSPRMESKEITRGGEEAREGERTDRLSPELVMSRPSRSSSAERSPVSSDSGHSHGAVVARPARSSSRIAEPFGPVSPSAPSSITNDQPPNSSYGTQPAPSTRSILNKNYEKRMSRKNLHPRMLGTGMGREKRISRMSVDDDDGVGETFQFDDEDEEDGGGMWTSLVKGMLQPTSPDTAGSGADWKEEQEKHLSRYSLLLRLLVLNCLV
ncbi:hypothetical protein BT69DRAFT_43421 [Atractiella rhizophila]|nr:hypothetical protein BT69DRAFT_43421 [Atractiella rhizophila]